MVSDTTITSTGALSVSSGSKTGRVPKDKRIVYDEITKDVSKLFYYLFNYLDDLVGRRKYSHESSRILEK